MTRDEAQACGQCECCEAWRRERDAVAHDCESWRMEGIGCADCNPLAQAAAPVGEAERRFTQRELAEAVIHGIRSARNQWVCPNCQAQSAPREVERQDCIPCVTATWCDLAGRCLAECSPGDDDAPLRAVYEPPAALKE